VEKEYLLSRRNKKEGENPQIKEPNPSKQTYSMGVCGLMVFWGLKMRRIDQ